MTQSFITLFGESFRNIWLGIQCMYIWGVYTYVYTRVYNIHIQLWFTYNTKIKSFITSFGESFRDTWLDMQCTYIRTVGVCTNIHLCAQHTRTIMVYVQYKKSKKIHMNVLLITKNTPSTIKLCIVHVLCLWLGTDLQYMSSEQMSSH